MINPVAEIGTGREGLTFHQLFEEQVLCAPEASAVISGSQCLTYQQLNEHSNQLAHYLQQIGVGPGTLVGLCVDRSIEGIVGLCGILKAGGAYLPLDIGHPKERLAAILSDAKVPVLLTQSGLLQLLPKAGGDREGQRFVVCLDRDWPLLESQQRTNPVPTAKPEDLAYVIYTSGSTGVPKGVMVEHRALLSHSVEFARHFEFKPSDRVLHFAPLTFDVSAEEIFPTLLTGATLVFRPDDWYFPVQDFHEFLVREKLTILNLPTQYWNQWMEEMGSRELELPSSLRIMIVGSDTVTVDQYIRWRKLAKNRIRWCNAYGVTEATISSTIYEPDSDDVPSLVPIGRPLANTTVYVLDEHQQPAAVGVVGELCIGGEEVARGYLNAPELTAQKFIPDPFSADPGARLVRTGDLGRLLPDGNLEFLGRVDDQVKVRGFRIELGEVESLLRQHPLVKDAVVLARPDSFGEKRLVAYFVPVNPTPQQTGKLLRFLKQKLPAYMIPAAFVPLKSLPLLSCGKVDRKKLPLPDTHRPELEEAFIEPTDLIEEKLAAIWGEVLGLEKIGIHDNFFDLGGNSLLAARLFTEIEKKAGWKLPLVTLFESPTISLLAESIRRDALSTTRGVLVPLQTSGSKPPLFLVHGAGGGMLWGYANLAKHLDANQPVYCFDPRNMEGLEEWATIEQMAAHYLQALRSFQPTGPYCLGGYCFGGEVAFEMAQQLHDQGERVSTLVMFNAMPPNSRFERVKVTPLFVVKFAWNSWHWFRYFCHWTPEQRHDFSRRKLRLIKKYFGQLIGRSEMGPIPVKAEDRIDVSLYPDYQRRFWDIHLRASAQYHPRPYPGHITVFRTRIYPFLCSFDPTFGWGEFAEDGVTVRVVSGAHESILDEPYVRGLAKEVKLSLLPKASTRLSMVPMLDYLAQVLSWAGAV
jgi:amino acid adenylation domain-containing protein